MMKKKAKKTGKNARKAAPKRRAGKKKTKDAGQVREEIAGMVKQEAKKITAAVVDKAKLGELAPIKYLFEVAKIYPQVEGEENPQEEENLAKMLLARLEPAKKAEGEGEAQEKDSSKEVKVENAESKPDGKEGSAPLLEKSSEIRL
jgi:hypothetical protein